MRRLSTVDTVFLIFCAIVALAIFIPNYLEFKKMHEEETRQIEAEIHQDASAHP